MEQLIDAQFPKNGNFNSIRDISQNPYISGILGKSQIEKMLGKNIIIEPFDEKQLGRDSYDVTLGNKIYRQIQPSFLKNLFCCNSSFPLYNVWNKNITQNIWRLHLAEDLIINEKNVKGFTLHPNERILAYTNEKIGGKGHIASMLATKSHVERSGIDVCMSSNFGHTGFTNHWTLEITNMSKFYSVQIIVGMSIAQIIFMGIQGDYGEYDEKHTQWKDENMLPKLYENFSSLTGNKE